MLRHLVPVTYAGDHLKGTPENVPISGFVNSESDHMQRQL